MTRTILDDVSDIITGITCDQCGATSSSTLLRYRGWFDGEPRHICAACVGAFVRILLPQSKGVGAQSV